MWRGHLNFIVYGECFAVRTTDGSSLRRAGHHYRFIELDTDGNLKLSKAEMEPFLKEL